MSRHSTIKALNRFSAREAKRDSRPKRKNKKPEFEFKKLAKQWLIKNGFCCDVVESKAVYNHEAGRFLDGQAVRGFSDVVGVTPYWGVACFIELKAPGRRGSLKVHQRDFLLSKIKMGAFAVCVDSLEVLSNIYSEWLLLRSRRKFEESKDLLTDHLPTVKELTDNLSDIIDAD